jgi:murein DD-endopeptidase MepM/ murein hydrolase activator NlpD
MKKKTSIYLTVPNLLVCLLVSFYLLADLKSISAQEPQEFLNPIFYEDEEISSIFDHNLPLPAQGEEDDPDGNECTQHNDGSLCRDNPPFGLGYDGHNGIDYDLNYKPVLAAANGIATEANWVHPTNHQLGLGLRIEIEHDNGYVTKYGHFSAIMVKKGQPVLADASDRKNIIGISGSTGNSTGSHLHFGVTNAEGIDVNPYGWEGVEGQDPWEAHADGAASYDLWHQYPAITTGQFLPPGAVINEPPVSGYYLIEMDDSDPEYFVKDGNCWTEGAGGINGEHHEAVVEIVDVDNPPPPSCYAKWLIDPEIAAPAGEYDVYVHIPDSASALHTFYKVLHSGKYDEAIVVQAAYVDNGEHDAWAYIGHYDFRLNGHPSDEGSMEYVQVTNQTLDDDIAPGTVVVADAIRLYPSAQPPDLERAISLSSDDAGGPNQRWAGYCAPESNQLNEIYLGHCEDGSTTISGFRFENVTVLEDTSIAEARLEFTVDTSLDNVIDLQFQGELVNDANTFSSFSYPSQRSPLTNAVVAWHIANDGGWLVGNIQTSPDLSTIIQEIIDQPGWEDGNAIAIIVQPSSAGTSPRRVFGWERNGDSLQTAKLQLWYEEPATPTPTPVPTITPTASPTPSSSVPAPTGLTAVYYNGLFYPTDSSTLRVKPTPIASDSFVRLSWQGSYPTGTTFYIYRSNTYPVPVDLGHRIGSSTQRWYTDYAGQAGNWYVVTAVNSNGTSPPSNHAQAHPYCPEC